MQSTKLNFRNKTSLLPTAIGLLGLLVYGSGAAFGQSGSGKTGAKQKPAQGEQNPPESKPIPELGPDARFDYQGEITYTFQHLFSFRSKYDDANSFHSRDETELTHTYTAFLGARLAPNLEVYINPELALGNGIGGDSGLAGNTNADIIGQSSLRAEPYLARYFVRWRVPMKHLAGKHGPERVRAEQVGRAPNIIEGSVPAHRLVIQAGKFGINDVFDTNSYANNARTQFLNDAFNNNLAYDAAQETRGYNLGVSVSWVNPTFAVRFGSFAMPTTAGGPDLAYNLGHDHSEQIEGEIHPQLLRAPKPPLIVRLLGYRNVGDMGNYSEALEQMTAGMAPDVTLTRRSGRVKVGLGLNLEQALADGGDTGVFARFGVSDGAVESYNFTEADSFLSFGAQVSGAHWNRKEDRVGVAFAQSDLTNSHKNYLAAGGQGLTLGDGALRYDSERIVEGYYSYQLTKPLSLTLDYQFIQNPGYNRDRGPASVLSVRAHYTF